MKTEKGFTLIEVLIGLMVFSIICLVFIGGLAFSLKATILLDGRTTAAALASGEFEYITSHTYITNAAWGYSLPSGTRHWSGGNAIPTGYTLIVVPAAMDGYPVSTMQKVTVTVTRGTPGSSGYVTYPLTGYWRSP